MGWDVNGATRSCKRRWFPLSLSQTFSPFVLTIHTTATRWRRVTKQRSRFKLWDFLRTFFFVLDANWNDPSRAFFSFLSFSLYFHKPILETRIEQIANSGLVCYFDQLPFTWLSMGGICRRHGGLSPDWHLIRHCCRWGDAESFSQRPTSTNGELIRGQFQGKKKNDYSLSNSKFIRRSLKKEIMKFHPSCRE